MSADRSVPLLIAAAVLVVAVGAAVVLFGVERPPEVERVTVADAQLPTAPVAWTTSDRDEVCIRVLRPDGSTRDVACGAADGELIAWDDDGILLREFRGPDDRVIAIDPVTGERSSHEPVRPPATDGPQPPWTRRADGRLIVSIPAPDRDQTQEPAPDPDAVDRTVWEVEAPPSYDVVTAVESPDGSMVALVDSADRLLVVAPDGGSPPRLWAEDVPRYGTLVWEGTRPRPVADGRGG